MLLISGVLVLSLSAAEFQVGKVTFYLKGGFAGLTQELDTDGRTAQKYIFF